MGEATQRIAPTLAKAGPADGAVKTANLQAVAFKVSPAFRRRFRQRAADASLAITTRVRRVAFCRTEDIGTPKLVFAAQWPASALSYRRFATALSGRHA